MPEDAANAMSMVAAADYSLTFRPGYEPENVSPAQWFEEIIRFCGQPEIVVTKKTKRGEKQLDLKPLIYEIRLAESTEFHAGDNGAGSAVPALFMKISAGSAANVKPEQILDAFYASKAMERPAFAYMVQREEVYGDTASDSEREEGRHCFLPLGAFGQDIEHG